jgi:hypothetical protein
MPAELTIDLDLDRDDAAAEQLSLRQRLRRRYPIKKIAGAGAVAVAGVALAAASLVERASPLPASPPSLPQTAAAQHAQLIAPATAAPGQRIIVLAYRNQNLCGPAELRLDGTPVPQHKLTDAGPEPHTYQQLFIAMNLPRWTTPGRHRIDLLGPVQSETGDMCGDRPEHQARIDSTVISITPRGS